MSRSDIPAHWTPVQQAAWLTVHDYVDPKTGRKGSAVLGPKLGKSPASLSNEVNPDIPTHKHGVEDSITVQLITQDYRELHAYAAELHHVAIPLPNFQPVSDVELLNQFTRWQAKMGETCQAINDTLEDGVVSPMEVLQVRARGFAHMREFLTFLHRLDSIKEDSHD